MSRTTRAMSSKPRSYAAYAKGVACVVGVIAIVWLLNRLLSNPELIVSFLEAAKDHPGLAIPLFMLANAFAPLLLLLPSGPFNLLAGAVWGVPLAFLISGSASFCANMMAFVVGRFMLRDRLTTYMKENVSSFPAIQSAITAEGWR